mmetsp:Transcript_21223/g.52302  ORF Transcript_21223/g.52302 Transcript_21223/m.52302 type:complete len:138 (+) Transcript_21223:136-549(+)|eukprot:CAMPEP_0174899126 /NCGR_PEP_ID=MMETSP0167-20121228/25555_1 /TAXON_ID=38298 /ORGANISM="Rhodella maculata, Strain CCMP736" /LENGTH=137 /DNA_ID=CAMNT_0016140001 /DNA_START=126 /DNA_END=539 /DNA_ORIENTATION=-
MAFLTAPALTPATLGTRPGTLCGTRPLPSLQTAPRLKSRAPVYRAMSDQLNENVSEIAKSVGDKSREVAGKTYDAGISARDTVMEIAEDGAKTTNEKVSDAAKETGEMIKDGSKSAAGAVVKGAEDVTGWVKDQLKD